MNSRGMANVLLMAIFVFMVSVSLIIVHQVNVGLDDAVSPAITSVAGEQIGGNIRDDSVSTIDSIALWLIIGLSLISVVLSLFSNKNPAFFFVSVVLMFIVLYVSIVLSNNYFEFVQDVDIALVEEDLTFLPHLARNLPFYILGYAVIFLLGFANLLRGRFDDGGSL